MKCPECGHESDGAFCPKCGAALHGGHCVHCGAKLPPDASFCTSCGEAVAPRGGGFRSPTPWIAAAAVAVILVVAFLLPGWLENRPTAPPPVANPGAAPMAGEAAGGLSSDPLAGGPRNAADRLFNRVMQTVAQGDTSGARFFVPMALEAYDMAAPLDDDALYHVGLLHLVNDEPEAARRTAEQVLSASPDHLLLLIVAAEADRATGNDAEARELYQRFLDHYDEEVAKGLQEYQDHQPILPEYRSEAQAFLAR